jgi:hypothetical protein
VFNRTVLYRDKVVGDDNCAFFHCASHCRCFPALPFSLPFAAWLKAWISGLQLDRGSHLSLVLSAIKPSAEQGVCFAAIKGSVQAGVCIKNFTEFLTLFRLSTIMAFAALYLCYQPVLLHSFTAAVNGQA